jgi:transcription antitermination factor NusG
MDEKREKFNLKIAELEKYKEHSQVQRKEFGRFIKVMFDNQEVDKNSIV